MLSALRKISESSRSQHQPLRVSEEPADGNALFEALVCEFHWTALQIGAITCCMNASLASHRTWMLRSCRNLVPVEAAVVRLALRSWKDLELPRELAAAVGGIFFELIDAKRLALPLINRAGVIVGPQIPLEKLEQITAVWRKLAEDCYRAVHELEPEARWRLNGLYTGNTLVLGRFLRDAMSGKRSCVNRAGEVALPLLPQRRRTRRFVLMQPCKVVHNESTSIALAREISRNGIGLDCDRDFKLRDALSLEFRNGRKLRGTVVWYKAGKVAVQFDDSLTDDDPLMSNQRR
jgi:hypothetical protein